MNSQIQAIDFTSGASFSNGYVAGDTLYVSGQQGPDFNGNFTGADITLQTRNAIGAVKGVIEDAGFRLADVVSVTIFFTDLNDVAKMNAVYKELIPDPKPARAAVQVAGLIGGAKIEISAIAVKQ
jgi:2-iminobutanoate/2-iminopropanoate deaminase